jgi:IS5 family transposase
MVAGEGIGRNVLEKASARQPEEGAIDEDENVSGAGNATSAERLKSKDSRWRWRRRQRQLQQQQTKKQSRSPRWRKTRPHQGLVERSAFVVLKGEFTPHVHGQPSPVPCIRAHMSGP